MAKKRIRKTGDKTKKSSKIKIDLPFDRFLDGLMQVKPGKKGEPEKGDESEDRKDAKDS